MSAGPVPRGLGRDGTPARHARGPGDPAPDQPTPDWMDDEEWAAWLAAPVTGEDPPDPELEDPLPGEADLAGAREIPRGGVRLRRAARYGAGLPGAGRVRRRRRRGRRCLRRGVR
jgi:hypothetical protein